MESLQDHSCSICLGVFFNPVNTPCDHTFCQPCIVEVQVYKQQVVCPLCRKSIKDVYSLKIDDEREQLIKNTFPKQYQKRQNDIIQQRLLQKQAIKLTLQYGNTHEIISNPKPSRSNPNIMNSHRWKCFLKVIPSQGVPQDYIEKVEFQLHETFQNPLITCHNAPYEYTTSGWGCFPIPIKIYWKISTGISTPTKLVWDLQFESPLQQKTHEIKINKSESNSDNLQIN
ncbi:hypothetical protein ABPG72_012289 [Tetrahymena utriculariae]